MRIYQDVWDKIIKRQSMSKDHSNPQSQHSTRKDTTSRKVGWKPKKAGRHIKQMRKKNRKTSNDYLLEFHKINQGEYEKYKKHNVDQGDLNPKTRRKLFKKIKGE